MKRALVRRGARTFTDLRLKRLSLALEQPIALLALGDALQV